MVIQFMIELYTRNPRVAASLVLEVKLKEASDLIIILFISFGILR